MRIFFIIILSLLEIGVYAQKKVIPINTSTNDYYEFGQKINKTTLLVITDQDLVDEEFSTDVKEIIEKEFEKSWTFNEFQFVTSEEAEKHVSNSNYSFFMMYSAKWSELSTDHISFTIVQGNKNAKDFKSSEFYEKAHMLNFSLDFEKEIIGKGKHKKELISIIDYRNYLPYIIGYFNQTLHRLYKKDKTFSLAGTPVERKKMVKWHITYYNDGEEKLAGKTVYIDATILPKDFDQEDFYEKMNRAVEGGFYFKVVNSKDVKEEIFGKNTDAKFFGYYYDDFKPKLSKHKYYYISVYSIEEKRLLAEYTTVYDHTLYNIAGYTISTAIAVGLFALAFR